MHFVPSGNLDAPFATREIALLDEFANVHAPGDNAALVDLVEPLGNLLREPQFRFRSFSWPDVGMVCSEAEVAALPLSAVGVIAVAQDPPVAADHHLTLLESRSPRHLWSPIRLGNPANSAGRWSRTPKTGHIMDHDTSYYKEK